MCRGFISGWWVAGSHWNVFTIRSGVFPSVMVQLLWLIWGTFSICPRPICLWGLSSGHAHQCLMINCFTQCSPKTENWSNLLFAMGLSSQFWIQELWQLNHMKKQMTAGAWWMCLGVHVCLLYFCSVLHSQTFWTDVCICVCCCWVSLLATLQREAELA